MHRMLKISNLFCKNTMDSKGLNMGYKYTRSESVHSQKVSTVISNNISNIIYIENVVIQ